MSETIDFKEMVKGLPTAASAAGNVMTADAQGALSLLPISSLRVVNLNGKEAANTELDVKEFHTKYLKGLPVGTMVTDPACFLDTRWFVKLSDNLKLNVQHYIFIVTKNRGSVNTTWSYLSFLALPSYDGAEIYKVNILVSSNVSDVYVTCRKVNLTSVTLT